MYSVKPNHSYLTLITFYSRTMKTSSSKQLEFVRFLFFLEPVLLHFTSYNRFYTDVVYFVYLLPYQILLKQMYVQRLKLNTR